MKSIYDNHIHCSGEVIYLKKPLTFIFKRKWNRFKFYYKTSVPELNIYAFDDNIVDVVIDLCDEISANYEFYGREDDVNLTGDAICLKNLYLEYINKIVPIEEDIHLNWKNE